MLFPQQELGMSLGERKPRLSLALVGGIYHSPEIRGAGLLSFIQAKIDNAPTVFTLGLMDVKDKEEYAKRLGQRFIEWLTIWIQSRITQDICL